MDQSEVAKLSAFFIATAISLASFHTGLVRLIVSVKKDDVARERAGVFIVLQCVGIVVLCAPLPLLLQILFASQVPFRVPAVIAPVVSVMAALFDMFLAYTKSKPGAYYWCVAGAFFFFNLILVFCDWSAFPMRFYLCLGLLLFVISAQLYRTAHRFAFQPPDA